MTPHLSDLKLKGHCLYYLSLTGWWGSVPCCPQLRIQADRAISVLLWQPKLIFFMYGLAEFLLAMTRHITHLTLKGCDYIILPWT
jgi:hypothetical protein